MLHPHRISYSIKRLYVSHFWASDFNCLWFTFRKRTWQTMKKETSGVYHLVHILTEAVSDRLCDLFNHRMCQWFKMHGTVARCQNSVTTNSNTSAGGHIMDDITLGDTAEVDVTTLVTCQLCSGIRILQKQSMQCSLARGSIVRSQLIENVSMNYVRWEIRLPYPKLASLEAKLHRVPTGMRVMPQDPVVKLVAYVTVNTL